MYKPCRKQIAFTDFNQPVGLELDPENRWIKMAELVPWDAIEDKYAKLFPSKVGYPSKPLRLVLGALIIQKLYNYSDRELVHQIQENPYFQYFCGYPGYDSRQEPFNASALVSFRKRLSLDDLSEVNEMIIDLAEGRKENAAQKTGKAKNDDPGVPGAAGGVKSECEQVQPVPESSKDEADEAEAKASETEKPDAPENASSQPAPAEAAKAEAAQCTNSGTLIMDATCAPSNIRYPQDVSLLNEAREKAEAIIDVLHRQVPGRKPRTRRIRAAKEYKAYSLKRRHSRKETRKQIRAQLSYLRRDLEFIENLKKAGAVPSEKDTKLLETLQTLYDQQKYMYDNKVHRVPDRIVSIEQPYIRPIVRGKVKNPTEFGAKVQMSISNGYARFDRVSWDAFNESTELQKSIEAYYDREGCWPERVLADKIYRNRENLRFCKERGIRLMGPPLGRPKKDAEQDRKIAHEDGIDRIEIERQFSLAKRCGGLGMIYTRRKETSECSLGLSVIVLNLKNILRREEALFFCLFRIRATFEWICDTFRKIISDRPARLLPGGPQGPLVNLGNC